MCTNCCTAIPHVNRVIATGNTPLVKVVIIPEAFPPFTYSASNTGNITSAITVLYFSILDFVVFWTCCVMSFQNIGMQTSI